MSDLSRAPLRGDQRAHLRAQMDQHVRARASYRQIEKREQLLDDAIAGRVTRSGGRRISARDPIWTDDLIIAAIRKWAADHGQPPTVNGWFYAGDDRPGRVTVINRFGSWNAAIAAAGFQPRQQGGFWVGARIVREERERAT